MQKKLIITRLLIVLFYMTGAFVSANAFGSDKNIYAQVFSDETGTEKKQDDAFENTLNERSFFESTESSIFENEDDILKAPPKFEDDGTHPPGGQGNPTLSLNNFYPLLLIACLFGFCRLFIYFLGDKNKNK